MRRTPAVPLALLALAVLAAGPLAPSAAGQKLAKYGADFLSGGVGGRALGMGAAVGVANDVSAGYWNAAGLTALAYPEVAYLHAERFASTVSFDYGAVAFPVGSRSTVGVSYFRSGVNDIQNTLSAWDAERDQPRPDYDAYLSTFSAADQAFFLSYARQLRRDLSVGITGKLIRRNIGDFAEAWGYSFDVGATYRIGRVQLGANVQDAPAGMFQSWTVNPEAFNVNDETNPETGQPYTFQETFGQSLPEGGTYVVPPVARLGAGYALPLGGASLLVGADLDLAFDGAETYAFDAGGVSLHPRVGAELGYKGVVAFRAGLARIEPGASGSTQVSPVLGAGLTLKQFSIDYGFGDFAGLASELGQTHRVTARLVLQQPRFARKSE